MWIGIALATLLSYLVVSTLHIAGSFKHIEPHAKLTIIKVYDNVPGPEDMDLDDQTGMLFISSTDRWRYLHGEKTDDAIYTLRIASDSIPRRMKTDFTAEFHPHGISFIRNDSLPYLLVVNHNAAGSSVEVFNIRGDSLVHRSSYTQGGLCCPNDVTAIAPDKFYVTNDHGTQKGFKRTLEDYLRIPLSSLYYFDGTRWSEAYDGLNYANGVNRSTDKHTLYVTTTTGRNLLTFDREESGKLVLRETTPLHTGLDNINVDSEGSLWIAAHPKLLAFVGHAKDPSKHSPSQILNLHAQGTSAETYRVEEIYLDDGSGLSGSSVAVRYGNELFIGVVFESKVVRARLN